MEVISLMERPMYLSREAGGVVKWDSSNKRVTVIKPNVHIFLFKGDTVFGNVNVGKLKFNVFSLGQSDSRCSRESNRLPIQAVR